MFCPNCGTEHRDGEAFCGKCGASMKEDQSALSNDHAAFSKPLSKKAYLSQKATSETQTAAKLVLALTVLSLVIVIIGHITMNNTSLSKISFLKLGNLNEDAEELEDEIHEAADYYEEMFTYIEDDLSKKERAVAEDYIDAIQACGEKLSFSNMDKLVKAAEKIAELDIAGEFDLDQDIDELKELINVLKVFSGGLLIGAVLSLLFTIIGGLCRIRALVIAGMIFSTIYCFVIYGIVFAVLNVIVHIAMIKFLGDINKEYKRYRNGTINTY